MSGRSRSRRASETSRWRGVGSWRGNFGNVWKCARHARRRWSGSVSPVRSICTRCCRCRPRFLQRGPTHPDALSWLAAQWGVTDRLRQVVMRDTASTGRRLKRGHAVTGYGFFTDGETPHAAIGHFAKRWPALRFVLQPRPVD